MWTNFDEVFILLDTDENQMLDQKEFLKVPAHPLMIVPKEKAYLIADTDHDGLVNLTEWFQLFMLLNNVLMKTGTAEEMARDMRRYTYYMQDTMASRITPKGDGEGERRCWSGPGVCDKIVGPEARDDKTQEMRREGSVDTVPIDELTPARFYAEYLSRNKPVLIKKGASHWSAVRRWTDAYLNATVGGELVKAERSKSKRFGYEDASWGAVTEEDFTWSRFLERYKHQAGSDAGQNETGRAHLYVSSNIPRAMAPDVELPTNIVPCLAERCASN